MAKNERIEQIERTLWLMEYKDHWTRDDWGEYHALRAELGKLKA